MHSGHEPATDPVLVVYHLGERSKTVRGAGSVRNDVLSGICLMVHAKYEHGRVIPGRSAHDDLGRPCLDVPPCSFVREEKAGGLDNDIGANLAPPEVCRIHLGGETDTVAIDNHGVALDGDVSLELPVYGIVLEHVGQILGIQKVIDPHDLDIFEIFHHGTENHAPDTAETVDTQSYHDFISPIMAAATARDAPPPPRSSRILA